MGHGIEEAPDIRVEHPVHLSPVDAGVESIQRIMLATPRPEPTGEPNKVFLVDRLQHPHDRLLNNLVLQAPDAQRPLRAIGLRYVAPLGRMGSIAAAVHPIVQVFQFLFEIFSVGLSHHTIRPGRRIMLKRNVALLQEVDGDVMQQRGEPYIPTLSRRLAHGCQSGRRGFPAQCPDRGGLTAVSLGRGPSLHDLRQGLILFVRPLRRYYDLVRILIRVHAHLWPSPS